MNAVNPLPVPPSQRQVDRSADRHAEPSMEEILASIRRIIADDQAMPQAEAGPAAVPPPRLPPRDQASDPGAPSDEAHALAAYGRSAYGQVTAPQFPSPDGPAAEDAEDAAPVTAGAAERSAPADEAFLRAAMPDGAGRPTSPSEQDMPMRDHLARDAGYDLEERVLGSRDLPAEPPRASTLLSQSTDASLSSAFNMLAATRLADDSEELRAMARDMIRPLLKTWLDDNLPSLVERLVRAEIERVARGGR